VLNDRDIALFVLDHSKHGIEDLTKANMECSGNLKQTLTQMRNQCEQSQAQLSQMAIQKQWYQPAAPANPQDIQSVAQFYQAGMR